MSKFFRNNPGQKFHEIEKFELMISRIIDGVILCDSQEKILFINSSAKRLLKIQGDQDWRGHTLDDMGVNFLADYLHQALEQNIGEINKVATLKKTHSRLIGVHLELLKDSKNSEIGWMYVLRDVTKNWQNDQMRSSLTIASHEIKTPLNSILSAVELLLAPDLGDLNQKQQQCLNVIKSDLDSLNRLLSDILDLSRSGEGVQFLERRKEVALSLLVTRVLESLRPFARSKDIGLENQVPKSIPTFRGDRDRLKQVLTNLTENAIKYSRENSKVTIGAELVESELKVWVKDLGVGIPASKHQVIFKKFKQLDNYPDKVQRGYGLGLSIAKEIVEAMDGKIWVESKVNVGSTFYFIIPV